MIIALIGDVAYRSLLALNLGFEVVPNEPRRVAKTAALIADIELESIEPIGQKTAAAPAYTDDHFDSIWTEGASAVPEEDMNEAERQKLHSYDKGIMSQEERDEAARRNAALKTANMGLASMQDGDTKNLSANGKSVDVSFRSWGATGDNGQPAKGYTKGEYTVKGPEGTRYFEHSPNGPTLENAKAYAAEQAERHIMDTFLKAKTAARKTAAGYFVVGPTGASISGPFGTVSEARQELVNRNGAGVQFKGDGNDAEWEAEKPEQFPVGLNSVSGSRHFADRIDCPYCLSVLPEDSYEGTSVDGDYHRCPECGHQSVHSADANNEASELHTGSYEERASLPANLDEATAMFRQSGSSYDSDFFGPSEEHTLAPTKENVAPPPNAKYIEGDDEAKEEASKGRSRDSIASIHEAEGGDWDGPHRNPHRGDDDALTQNWGDEKVNDDEKTSKLAEMFPGSGAQVYRNEAGEPLGWDYPSSEEGGWTAPEDDDYDPWDRGAEYEPDDDDEDEEGQNVNPSHWGPYGRPEEMPL